MSGCTIQFIEPYHNPDEGRVIMNNNIYCLSGTIDSILTSGATKIESGNNIEVSSGTPGVYVVSLSEDVNINSISANTIFSGSTPLEQILSGNTYFDGNRVTTRSGVPSVYTSANTISEFLEAYFFPSVPPGASLSPVGGSIFEFGNSSAVNITLSWIATKNTKPLTSIMVDLEEMWNGSGESQAGTTGRTLTVNVNKTYSMTVYTSDESTSSSTSYSWRHKRYWGPQVADPINDAQIIALSNELSTTRAKSFSVTCSGQYIYYCYPTSWGAATFTVGGLTTTFILTTRTFINAYGYSESYNIYRSLNLQNGTSIPVVVS